MLGKKPGLLIVGAGGLGVEAAWVAQECRKSNPEFPEILGFLDENPEVTGKEVHGFKILGTPEEYSKNNPGQHFYHCAIGRNRARSRIMEKLDALGWKALSLIHPNVAISPDAQVGDGTYIGPGTVVAPYARVGRGVVINTSAGIGHHSVVDDYSQVCPGARVNGDCRVDKWAFIGSNASLQPKTVIGEGATVGACSLVIRSVEPLVTVIGVPARIVSRPAVRESPAE